MTATAYPGEVVYPDGRHELTPEADAALSDSPLHNADLAPVTMPKRIWSTYNYIALWIGMAHNVATWTLAAGLVALGMAWYQAILTIMIANVVVLVPMLPTAMPAPSTASRSRCSPGPRSACSGRTYQP